MPDFSKIWATNSPLPEYTFSDADYLTGWDFVAAAPPTKSQFDAWFKLTDQKLQWLYNQLQNTASQIYPVGAVYISVNSTSPASLFGGVWERLKDTFLLANGDTYAANTSGGSATKTISVNNLPSHTHSCSTVGNHTHTKGSMNITGSVTNTDATEPWGTADSFSNSGALKMESKIFAYGWTSGDQNSGGYKLSFDASKGWTGATSPNGSHTHTIGNTGSGLPLNIMPPYTTVYAWRRTA